MSDPTAHQHLCMYVLGDGHKQCLCECGATYKILDSDWTLPAAPTPAAPPDRSKLDVDTYTDLVLTDFVPTAAPPSKLRYTVRWDESGYYHIDLDGTPFITDKLSQSVATLMAANLNATPRAAAPATGTPDDDKIRCAGCGELFASEDLEEYGEEAGCPKCIAETKAMDVQPATGTPTLGDFARFAAESRPVLEATDAELSNAQPVTGTPTPTRGEHDMMCPLNMRFAGVMGYLACTCEAIAASSRPSGPETKLAAPREDRATRLTHDECMALDRLADEILATESNRPDAHHLQSARPKLRASGHGQ